MQVIMQNIITNDRLKSIIYLYRHFYFFSFQASDLDDNLVFFIEISFLLKSLSFLFINAFHILH